MPITQLLYQYCMRLYDNLHGIQSNGDPINGSLTRWNRSNSGEILIDESFIEAHRQNGQLFQIEDCTVHFIRMRPELVLFSQNLVVVVGPVDERGSCPVKDVVDQF